MDHTPFLYSALIRWVFVCGVAPRGPAVSLSVVTFYICSGDDRVERKWILESDEPQSKSWHCHLTAVWP